MNIINLVRGKLEIYLTSPSGMSVPILEQRKNDNSTEGFNDWVFMSAATWSENPRGLWRIKIIDNTNGIGYLNVGKCILMLHGTIIDPDAVQNDSQNEENINFYSDFDNTISES